MWEIVSYFVAFIENLNFTPKIYQATKNKYAIVDSGFTTINKFSQQLNVKKPQTEKTLILPNVLQCPNKRGGACHLQKKILPGNDVLRLPSPPNPAPSAEKFQSFKISVVAMIFIK